MFEPDSEVPRWVLIPFGILIFGVGIIMALPSLWFIIAQPGKNPAIAVLFGLFALFVAFLFFAIGIRLIRGKRDRQDGFFSARALRISSWLLFAIPIFGIIGQLVAGTFSFLPSIYSTVSLWLSSFTLAAMARNRR